MKNTEDIHQLIHSLSKAEKRHFKMSAARYSKNQNNYLLLFDAIDQQQVYDESKLKQKFKKHAFGKSINKTKYLLYELLLRSLRPLCNGKSIKSQLEGKLQSVDFLFSKSLYSQAVTLLKKTKKLANHYQLYPIQLQVLRWEKQLMQYDLDNPTFSKTEQLLQEYDRIAGKVRSEMRYRISVEKLQQMSRFFTPEQCSKLLEEELEDLPVEDSLSAPTFLSQVFRGELMAQRAFNQENTNQALLQQKKVYHLWEKHPHLREVFPEDFSRTTQTYVFYHLNGANKAVAYDKILSFYKEGLPQRTKEEKGKVNLQYILLDFIINLTQGNLQICTAQLMTIRDIEREYKRLLDVSMQIQLYYYIGIYYFLVKDFREAIEWVSKAQQFSNRQLHPRSQRFCELIELIARYELEEYEYLESAIRKMYRNLKQKSRRIEIESLVLKSVRQLLNVSNSSEVNHIFASLYDSLQKIDESVFHQDNLQTNLLYQWIHDYLPQENEELFN